MSVVDLDEHALLVELQLEVVGEFDLEASALLVDLHDAGAGEVDVDEGADVLGNEVGGDGIELAVDLIPVASLVEV